MGKIVQSSEAISIKERKYDLKTLKIGIASYEEMKERTLAIALGEIKPSWDEP